MKERFRTYTLSLEGWHPTRLNEVIGRHWSVKDKARSYMESLLYVEMRNQRVPEATGKRRVRLTLYGWLRGRLPDRDAWDKLLLDAMVQAGLLTDDGDAGLEGRMQVGYVRSAKKRTVIELEDC